MTQEMLTALAESPMERLRWLVMDRFSMPPGSELRDADCLWAAANMALDIDRGLLENPEFSESEFIRRKEARDG